MLSIGYGRRGGAKRVVRGQLGVIAARRSPGRRTKMSIGGRPARSRKVRTAPSVACVRRTRRYARVHNTTTAQLLSSSRWLAWARVAVGTRVDDDGLSWGGRPCRSGKKKRSTNDGLAMNVLAQTHLRCTRNAERYISAGGTVFFDPRLNFTRCRM